LSRVDQSPHVRADLPGGNSNTSRRLAEFWMIEPEIAFADLSDNSALAEARRPGPTIQIGADLGGCCKGEEVAVGRLSQGRSTRAWESSCDNAPHPGSAADTRQPPRGRR
jgi:hypothetical protein